VSKRHKVKSHFYPFYTFIPFIVYPNERERGRTIQQISENRYAHIREDKKDKTWGIAKEEEMKSRGQREMTTFFLA
jgi:hypothetical protein